MNPSGEAADQVMRMMLNGTEVLLKLSGAGAKQTAVLLYSALKQQNKTSGAARLSSMLRSGKPLKVYTFRDKDLEKFKECAKEYGVLFCILKDKDKTDGVFDVLVRAEDAAKLNRISERFKLVQVNATEIKSEIIKEAEEKTKNESGQAKSAEEKEPSEEQTEKSKSGESQEPPEKEARNDDRVADELLGVTEPENPLAARTEADPEAKASPSEPSSKEGIPPEVQTPSEMAESKSLSEREDIPNSVTGKPEESNPYEPISDSSSGTENRNGGQAEKKESVRAALKRIRQKREEAARSGELPKIKEKEHKGKDVR